MDLGILLLVAGSAATIVLLLTIEMSLIGIRKDLENYVIRHERFFSSYSLGIRAVRTVFDDLLEAGHDRERLTEEVEKILNDMRYELKRFNQRDEA